MKAVFLSTFSLLLVVTSCRHSSSYDEVPPATPHGEWQVDSVALGKTADVATVLSVVLMEQDSSGVRFRFSSDTLIVLSFHQTDTAHIRIDAAEKRLHVLNQQPVSYTYFLSGDARCTLTAGDGTAYFLKRSGRR